MDYGGGGNGANQKNLARSIHPKTGFSNIPMNGARRIKKLSPWSSKRAISIKTC